MTLSNYFETVEWTSLIQRENIQSESDFDRILRYRENAYIYMDNEKNNEVLPENENKVNIELEKRRKNNDLNMLFYKLKEEIFNTDLMVKNLLGEAYVKHKRSGPFLVFNRDQPNLLEVSKTNSGDPD